MFSNAVLNSALVILCKLLYVFGDLDEKKDEDEGEDEGEDGADFLEDLRLCFRVLLRPEHLPFPYQTHSAGYFLHCPFSE